MSTQSHTIVSKPHLSYGRGWWYCVGGLASGRGITPRKAYESWIDRMAFRMEMGL